MESAQSFAASTFAQIFDGAVPAPNRAAIRGLYPHATLYHSDDAGRGCFPTDLEVLQGLMAQDRAAVANGGEARGIAGDRAHAIRKTGRLAAERLAKAEALIAS